MAILAVVFGDTHPNSLSGLSPPKIELEERTHHANDVQRWYWARWLNLWNLEVPERSKWADEVWAFCVGDGADDNSHSKAGLVSLLAHDIVTIGAAVLEPVVANCDRLFILRGTPAHTHEYGALEELIARQLGDKVVKADSHQWTWWQLFVEIDGALGFFAHKARSYARRPWTAGGGVNRSTQFLAAHTAFKDEYAPYKTRVAFWAHGHYDAESTVPHCGWRGYFCPPWQASTAFGYQIGEVDICGPGAWFALCREGEATVSEKVYDLPHGKVWHERDHPRADGGSAHSTG